MQDFHLSPFDCCFVASKKVVVYSTPEVWKNYYILPDKEDYKDIYLPLTLKCTCAGICLGDVPVIQCINKYRQNITITLQALVGWINHKHKQINIIFSFYHHLSVILWLWKWGLPWKFTHLYCYINVLKKKLFIKIKIIMCLDLVLEC